MEENKTRKKSKDILKFLGFRTRKNFIIFLVFVLVSSVFWFLIALSKEYTTTISYPVKFTSLPKDRILVEKLPENIQLQIAGNGFDLLKYEFSGFIFPYIIDYSKISNHNHSNHFHLQTTTLLNQFRQKFPSNVTVQDIFPKTLTFTFSSMIKKKLPVEANILYRLAKQYVVHDKVLISPNYVIAKGPKAIIDTMKVAKTEQYDLKILDKPIKKILSLKKTKLVSYSADKVVLFLNVQQYTESVIKVPIVIKNMPDSLSIKFIPDKISVRYKSTLDHFKEILPKQFKAIANFSSITLSKDTKIPIVLEETPKEAFDISFSPKKVSFLLSQKQKKEND